MIDPLYGFDWVILYNRYDALCRKDFRPDALYLNAIQPRPRCDRELYYCLLERMNAERNSPKGISLGTYEALLYWKYYSQPAPIANICEKTRNHPDRGRLQSELTLLSQSLRDVLARDKDTVIGLVKFFGQFALPGIKSRDTLPTRTTLLHMIYPDVVPVFDKQVLKAVDGWDSEYANKNIRRLKDYLEHAWKLADRYQSTFHAFTKETPLRLIDMALWVIRGSYKGQFSSSMNLSGKIDSEVLAMTNPDKVKKVVGIMFGSHDFSYEDLKQKVSGIPEGSIMPSDWTVNTKSECPKEEGALKKNAFLFCINKGDPKRNWRYRLYYPHSDGKWVYSEIEDDMIQVG